MMLPLTSSHPAPYVLDLARCHPWMLQWAFSQVDISSQVSFYVNQQSCQTSLSDQISISHYLSGILDSSDLPSVRIMPRFLIQNFLTFDVFFRHNSPNQLLLVLGNLFSPILKKLFPLPVRASTRAPWAWSWQTSPRSLEDSF